MKRIIVLTAIILLTTNPALAQEVVEKPITFADLQVSEPAILAGNPFYFLKDIRWSFQRLFISSELKELGLKANLLAQKAAEMKKTEEVASRNHKLVEEAMSQYQNALVTYKAALKKIAESSLSERVDGSRIAEQLSLHLRLAKQLQETRFNPAEQAILLDIVDHLTDALQLANALRGNSR